MMNNFIQFGSKKIDYTLVYSARKTLGISITPNLEVIVKAPTNTAIEKVETIIKKKAPWIIKQQSFFLGFYPKMPTKKYVSGETHLYLGRQYKLKIIIAKKNEIHFNAKEILVYAKTKEQTKAILNKWYRERAKMKFAEIAEPIIERFKKYNVEPHSIYIQEMANRWGSCTPKGKIILNPELIKAPKSCIEYVITHELCHLVHRNHTIKFFNLQHKEMPTWEKWKTKLEHLLA
jgi:predicted metal-dependent hydrolase